VQARTPRDMQKYRNIRELFEGGSERLTTLKARSRQRSRVLGHVLAALPPELARAIASAGIDQRRLTIGVVGAGWATRLRYGTDPLRQHVAAAMGVKIDSVRIKVVQPAG
jgi:hypothetical protein